MELAHANIAVIVRAAGHDMTDVGWLTWFVTDKAEYLACKRVVGNAYNVCSVNNFLQCVAGHCE